MIKKEYQSPSIEITEYAQKDVLYASNVDYYIDGKSTGAEFFEDWLDLGY